MSTTVLSSKVLKSLDKKFEAAFGLNPQAIALEQARTLFGEADALRKSARDIDKGLEPVRLDLETEAKAKTKALEALKVVESKKDAARKTLLARHSVELAPDRLNKKDGTGFVAKIKWINSEIYEIFKEERASQLVKYEQAVAALTETHARLSAETSKLNAQMKAAWLKDQEAIGVLKAAGIEATRKEVVK